MTGNEEKPIFRDLTADDPDPETTEIESLCMNCGENGVTRLLLTKIPFYKEVVLMSFSCEHCGYRNNEIQSGAKIEERGIRIVLKAAGPRDLNRQIVKSDFSSIKIPELDFEIPSQSQKGEITTVEGVLDRAIANLKQDQETRHKADPQCASLIEQFLEKLKALKELTAPFTLILEDISGNSFIENPRAPQKDVNTEVTHFVRSVEQNHCLGIYTPDEIKDTESDIEKQSQGSGGLLHPIIEGQFTLEDFEGEVLQIPTNCPDCGSPCETNMKLSKIPHFKEVVIMATMCEKCGHRTNEVKSGGGIEPNGIRIEVKINSKDDFSRDLLKSETCRIEVPELELEVGSYALGGRFTTVEGLLMAIKGQLAEQGGMFRDSSDDVTKLRMQKFLGELDSVLANERSVTLVLDDPAGNSYVQSLMEDEPDPGLKITTYERTFEHNEELGINDMKTEGYEDQS